MTGRVLNYSELCSSEIASRFKAVSIVSSVRLVIEIDRLILIYIEI